MAAGGPAIKEMASGSLEVTMSTTSAGGEWKEDETILQCKKRKFVKFILTLILAVIPARSRSKSPAWNSVECHS